MKWNEMFLILLAFLALYAPVQPASLKASATGILCDACSEMVDAIRKLVELKTSESLIEEATIEYCKLFKLADDRICKMIIPEFKVRQYLCLLLKGI